MSNVIERAVLAPVEAMGGEHHAIELQLLADEEYNYFNLKVDSTCYGAHSSTFEMMLPQATPEEVERWAMDLMKVASKMREREAKERQAAKS